MRFSRLHRIISKLICRHWPVRRYPWGTIETMSSCHSDLLSLKRVLFETAPGLTKILTEERFTGFRARETELRRIVGSKQWREGERVMAEFRAEEAKRKEKEMASET